MTTPKQPRYFNDPVKQKAYEDEMRKANPYLQSQEDDSISVGKLVAANALGAFGDLRAGVEGGAKALGIGTDEYINSPTINEVDAALANLGWLQQSDAAKKRMEDGGRLFQEGSDNILSPTDLRLNENFDIGAFGANMLGSATRMGVGIAAGGGVGGAAAKGFGLAAKAAARTGAGIGSGVGEVGGQTVGAGSQYLQNESEVFTSPAYLEALSKGLKGQDAINYAVASVQRGATIGAAPSAILGGMIGGSIAGRALGEGGQLALKQAGKAVAGTAAMEGAQEVASGVSTQLGGKYLGGGGEAIEVGQGSADDLVAGMVMGGTLRGGAEGINLASASLAKANQERVRREIEAAEKQAAEQEAKPIDAPGGMGSQITLDAAEDIAAKATEGGALSSSIMHASSVESGKKEARAEIDNVSNQIDIEQNVSEPSVAPVEVSRSGQAVASQAEPLSAEPVKTTSEAPVVSSNQDVDTRRRQTFSSNVSSVIGELSTSDKSSIEYSFDVISPDIKIVPLENIQESDRALVKASMGGNATSFVNGVVVFDNSAKSGKAAGFIEAAVDGIARKAIEDGSGDVKTFDRLLDASKNFISKAVKLDDKEFDKLPRAIRDIALNLDFNDSAQVEGNLPRIVSAILSSPKIKSFQTNANEASKKEYSEFVSSFAKSIGLNLKDNAPAAEVLEAFLDNLPSKEFVAPKKKKRAAKNTTPKKETKKPAARMKADDVKSEAEVKKNYFASRVRTVSALKKAADDLGIGAIIDGIASVGKSRHFDNPNATVYAVFETSPDGIERVVFNATAFDGMSDSALAEKMAATLIHELAHGHFQRLAAGFGVSTPAALSAKLKEKYGERYENALKKVKSIEAYKGFDDMAIIDEAVSHMVEGKVLADESAKGPLKAIYDVIADFAKSILKRALSNISKKTKFESVKALADSVSARLDDKSGTAVDNLIREIIDGVAIKSGVGARTAEQAFDDSKRPTLRAARAFRAEFEKLTGTYAPKAILANMPIDPLSREAFDASSDAMIPDGMLPSVKVVEKMLEESGYEGAKDLAREFARFIPVLKGFDKNGEPVFVSERAKRKAISKAFLVAAIKKNDKAFDSMLDLGLNPFAPIANDGMIPFVVAVKKGLPSAKRAVLMLNRQSVPNYDAIVEAISNMPEGAEVVKFMASYRDASQFAEAFNTTTLKLKNGEGVPQSVIDGYKDIINRPAGSVKDVGEYKVRFSADNKVDKLDFINGTARIALSKAKSGLKGIARKIRYQHAVLEMSEAGRLFKSASNYFNRIKASVSEYGIDGRTGIQLAMKDLSKAERDEVASIINATVNGHNINFEESNKDFVARIEKMKDEGEKDPVQMELYKTYKKDISRENLNKRQAIIDRYKALSSKQKDAVNSVRSKFANVVKMDLATLMAGIISKMAFDAKDIEGVSVADAINESILKNAKDESVSIDKLYEEAMSKYFEMSKKNLEAEIDKYDREIEEIKAKTEQEIRAFLEKNGVASATIENVISLQKKALAEGDTVKVKEMLDAGLTEGLANGVKYGLKGKFKGYDSAAVEVKRRIASKAKRETLINSDVASLKKKRSELSKELEKAIALNDKEAIEENRSEIERIDSALESEVIVIAEELRSSMIRTKEVISSGYVPQKRFGAFALTVRKDLGEGKSEIALFARFDSEIEAQDAFNEFVKKGTIEGYDSIEQRFSDNERAAMTHSISQVSPTLSNTFANVLDSDLVEAIAGKADRDASNEYGTELGIAMRDIARKMAAVNSAMKNELKRKGTQGESKDIERVYADAAVLLADNSAKRLASFRMLNAISEADKNKETDTEGLGEYLANAYKYIMNPQEEFSFLRGLMFYMKIGLSVMSSLFNLTGIATNVLAWSTNLVGYNNSKVMKSFVAATKFVYKNFGMMSYLTGQRQNVQKDFDYSMFNELGEGVSDKVKRYFEEGFVSTGESFKMQQMASGSIASKVGGIQKILDMASAPFAFTESLNRITTLVVALTVFDVMKTEQGSTNGTVSVKKRARGKGLLTEKSEVSLTMNEADFVKDFIDMTQGDYEKTGRSEIERGVGALIMQFKKYPAISLELLAAMGWKGRGIMTLMLVLIAGGGGAPLAQDLAALLDAVAYTAGHEDFSTAETARHLTGDVPFLNEGVLGMVMDTSRARLSMSPEIGKIMDPNNKNTAEDFIKLLGPSVGVLYGAFDKGGVDKLGITSLSNTVKAVEIAYTGEFRDSYGRTVKQLDDPYITAIGRLLSAQSVEVRDYRDPIDRAKRFEDGVKAVKKKLEDRYIKARREGDVEAAREAIREMREYERDKGVKLGYNIPNLNKRAKKLDEDLKDRTIEGVGKVRRTEAQRQMEE